MNTPNLATMMDSIAHVFASSDTPKGKLIVNLPRAMLDAAVTAGIDIDKEASDAAIRHGFTDAEVVAE